MPSLQKFGYLSLFSLATVIGGLSYGNPANAVCLPGGPYNNAANNITCDPGAGENLNTLGGNDTVTVNSGTVGTINMANGRDTLILNGGAVTQIDQGSGRDTITMVGGSIDIIIQGSSRDTLTISGGTVTTSIDQGSFADTLTITNGIIGTIQQGTGRDVLTISGGTTGAIVQGGQRDTFTMNAGTITTLDQGAARDTATINGGHIIGLFEGGDIVNFHGGRIGSVNIGPGANIFIMDGTSGPVSIDTFLNAEQGADTITLTAGIIGTFVNSGNGADAVTVDGTDIGTNLLTEGGADIIILASGTIGGNVNSGNRDDNITLSGLRVFGAIITGNGNDTFNWSAGRFSNFDGGDGSDTATITASEFNGSRVLDGGDDISSADGFIDRLNINTVTATLNGANIINWEIISFASSTITITDLITETVNVCGGSTTLGGASTANDVLGCVSKDTITITGNTVISNVIEGAGGDDVISITGNASVTNGVFGGQAGQDNSAGADGNDTITIDTTGTILIVDAGKGNDTINLTSGTVTTDILGQTGDDTFNWSAGTFARFIGGDGSDIAIVTASQFNGSRVLDGGDDVSSADGFIDSLTFRGLTATANGANIINWENVVIDNSNISFSNTSLTAGTTTITNNGILDAGNKFTIIGNLSTNPTGTFKATGVGNGIFRIIGNVNNTGLIRMADNNPGDQFIVTANFTGDGIVSIDTVLGGSSSKTDKLVIKGNSSGTTAIRVTNNGGSGQKTGTASNDGIKIVQVNGSSNGNFVLANSLSVGIYSYSLNKADNQNWYLQSRLQNQIYGYSSLQAVLGKEVDSYWQRTGKQNQLFNRDGSAATNGSGFWMRSFYSNSTAAAATKFGYSSNSSNLDYTRTFVQVGYDHRLLTNQNGRLIAGIFGHYKRLNIAILDGAGSHLASTRSSGFGGGASLSWANNGGFYGDLASSLTAWNNKITGANGVTASPRAIAYSLSAEGGYKINLDDFARLVPQAQLVWQDARFNNFTDSSGLAVNWNSNGVFTGRVGLGLELGKPIAKGGSGLTGYIIANLVHKFNRPGSISISGSSISTGISNTYVEGRLGFDLKTAVNGWTFYTEAGFAHSLGNHKYASFKGIGGIRVNLN